LHEDLAKYIVDNKLVLGKDFNPRSTKQIQDVIMQLGMEDKVEHSKKNRHVPKTDKKALAILSNDSVFFSMLSKFRFFTKHKGTYYDPLYSYYTSEKSDIAHFLMYQTGAKTGRFSVELAQTFPKPEESKLAGELHEVRKCLIPRRGKAFLCMDYEQQEMRLFVHYSNCKRMIDIINEKSDTKGFDIYVETADVMFGELFQREKLRKALRFTTKTDALGMIYGMGSGKLISSTTALLYEKFDRSVVEEIGVSDKWAYDVLRKFKELYPVDTYTRGCMSELYKTGVMRLKFDSPLMKFDRQYHIPRDFAYKAGNAKIQGTAAYVIKSAMLRCNDRIRREGWEGRVDMILQVHDELIFELDNDLSFIRHVYKTMKEEMDDRVTFSVPITTSGKWSSVSLGDVKEL
jgi:DNA polymerase I